MTTPSKYIIAPTVLPNDVKTRHATDGDFAEGDYYYKKSKSDGSLVAVHYETGERFFTWFDNTWKSTGKP